MSAEPLPLDISEVPFVYMYDEDVEEKWPSEGGKWMLFYPHSQLNEAWIRACDLYRSHQLTGIKGKNNDIRFKITCKIFAVSFFPAGVKHMKLYHISDAGNPSICFQRNYESGQQ